MDPLLGADVCVRIWKFRVSAGGGAITSNPWTEETKVRAQHKRKIDVDFIRLAWPPTPNDNGGRAAATRVFNTSDMIQQRTLRFPRFVTAPRGRERGI